MVSQCGAAQESAEWGITVKSNTDVVLQRKYTSKGFFIILYSRNSPPSTTVSKLFSWLK